MVRLACILTVLLWLTPQQEPEERSVEQELAALIEKTNALESFHLIYDVKSVDEDGDSEMSFELVYRAPDLGRMHVTGPEGEFDNWILGERAYFHREESWKSAALPEPLPFSYVLDDLFPADEKPLEAGVVVMLALSRKSPEKGGFQLSFASMPKGRTYVLGWLQNMQAWSGVTAEDSSLRWEDDGLRCVVSRETGLLEEVEVTSPKEHMILRLREGHANVPLDSELVTLPSAAAAAPIDADLSRAFVHSPNALRSAAFVRAEHQIASGKRAWNELVRNDWRAVLDALHRQRVVDGYTKWLEMIYAGIEQKAKQASAERDEDDSPEHRAELEKHVAEGRANLDDVISRGQTKYLDDLPAIESKQDEPRQELFDTEKEVIAELWDELLRKPVLKAYDEKLAEVLEH